MKKLLFTLLILAFSASAANIPDLTCFQNDVLVSYLDSSQLKFRDSHKYQGSEVYKIKNSKLYIDPSDRDEYVYGSVEEASSAFDVGRRYYSGSMMLNFNSYEYDNYDNATAVITSNTSIKSMTLRCVKS